MTTGLGFARRARAVAMLGFAVTLVAVLGLALLDTGAVMRATGQNDLTLHAAAFFVLAVLGRMCWPGLPLFGALLAIASCIELVQHFGPWREAGLADVAAGVVGATLGIAAIIVLRRIGGTSFGWIA